MLGQFSKFTPIVASKLARLAPRMVAPAVVTPIMSNAKVHPRFMSINTHKAVVPQPLSPVEGFLKFGVGGLLSPLALIGGGWYNVPNNHAGVVMRFGKYEQSRLEGLYWTLMPGMDMYSVFMGNQSFKLPQSQVVDSNGNPIIISAVVNFRIDNPENFVVFIQTDKEYIYNQAEAVIKKIASKYPYESEDGHGLKNESDMVTDEMTAALQERVGDKGVHIENVMLSDLNYAPEIAQQMLIKQQANAFVEAKQTITRASIDMVKDVTRELGNNISQDGKDRIITNLLTVLTSGTAVQPTIPLNR
jgi:regulator of protease activity HflC (stomatin/prohibitin superfamily)